MATSDQAPTSSPRARRGWRIAGIVLGTLVVVVVAFFLLFDWNWLKGPIQNGVARATGRTLEIGNIAGEWRLRPRIRFDQVRLSNPEWAASPHFLVADAVTMRISVLPLLARRVHMHELVLERPEMHLQRVQDGRATWVFDKDEEKQKEGEPPLIEVVRVDRGVLHYKDAITAADLVAQLEDRAAANDPRSLKFKLDGKFRGQPLKLAGETASVLALRNAAEHLPIAAKGTVAGTQVAIDGAIDGIAQFREARLRYDVKGPSLAALKPVFRVPLPETPPYAVSGYLAHEGELWRTTDLKGRVGKSDIAGTVTVNTGGKKPRLEANLTSNSLDLADLGPLVGGTNRSRLKPSAQEEARLLPARTFDLSAIDRLDAHVILRATRVMRVVKWPFDNFHADFRLQDSVITIDPLKFGMADGTLTNRVRLDGSGKTISASLDGRMQGVRVAKIAPEKAAMGEAAGILSGRVNLKGQGNSIAAMLGNADGRVGLLLSQGNVPGLLPAIIDLDGARVLANLFGKKPEAVRCTAFDVAVQKGIATPNVAIVETDTTVLNLAGQVNLKSEAIDLKLTQQPKRPSFLSIRTPILIGGTLMDPDFAPSPGPLAARGIAAAALAAINPLAALFALIETGPGEDGSCPVIQRGLQDNKAPQATTAGKAPAAGRG